MPKVNSPALTEGIDAELLQKSLDGTEEADAIFPRKDVRPPCRWMIALDARGHPKLSTSLPHSCMRRGLN